MNHTRGVTSWDTSSSQVRDTNTEAACPQAEVGQDRNSYEVNKTEVPMNSITAIDS